MINTNDLADYFLVLLNKRFAYTACFTVGDCLSRHESNPVCPSTNSIMSSTRCLSVDKLRSESNAMSVRRQITSALACHVDAWSQLNLPRGWMSRERVMASHWIMIALSLLFCTNCAGGLLYSWLNCVHISYLVILITNPPSSTLQQLLSQHQRQRLFHRPPPS